MPPPILAQHFLKWASQQADDGTTRFGSLHEQADDGTTQFGSLHEQADNGTTQFGSLHAAASAPPHTQLNFPKLTPPVCPSSTTGGLWNTCGSSAKVRSSMRMPS